MTLLDGMVILVLAASVIRSLMRGMIEEVFSLGAWIVAFLVAKWGASAIEPVLPIGIQNEGLRYFAGFAVVFLVMMIAVMLLGHLVKGAAGAIGLGGVDKFVGGLFGALRGVVIVVGFTLAAGLTSLPQTEFWKQATLSAPLETLAVAVEPLLPADLAKYIHYR